MLLICVCKTAMFLSVSFQGATTQYAESMCVCGWVCQCVCVGACDWKSTEDRL